MRKKSYLSFKDLRAFYDRKHDRIRLTTGDPDLAAQGWSLTLNRDTPAEQILRDALIEAGIIEVTPEDSKQHLTWDIETNQLVPDMPSAPRTYTTKDQLAAIDSLSQLDLDTPSSIHMAVDARPESIQVGEIGEARAVNELPKYRSSIGPYIGHTTGRVHEPVFFSPHSAIARNDAPGTVISGSPGAGKSFATFSIAYQAALRGTSLFYIDPKAEARALVTLPNMENLQVVDISSMQAGALSPATLTGDEKELAAQYIETIQILLGVNGITTKQRLAIAKAANRITALPASSLMEIIEDLGVSEDAEVRHVGTTLSLLTELPLAKTLFAPAEVMAPAPSGSFIITARGLDLPAADLPIEHYSNANLLAVAIMHRLVAAGRAYMLAQDRTKPKMLVLEQAWTLTNNRQGQATLSDISRIGRSQNVALLLVDPIFKDNMGYGISNWLTFRTKGPSKIEDALALMALTFDMQNQNLLRNLKNGEFVLKEGNESPKTVQFAADEIVARTFTGGQISARDIDEPAEVKFTVQYGQGEPATYVTAQQRWVVLKELEGTMKVRLDLSRQQGFESYHQSLPVAQQRQGAILVTIDNFADLLASFPEDSMDPTLGTREQLLRTVKNLAEQGRRASILIHFKGRVH